MHLIINTPAGRIPKQDEVIIRSTAALYNVAVITTLAGAIASTKAIDVLRKDTLGVKSIQEYHKAILK
jgi:carbamoyl-phosphate synthase large subunit